MVSLNEGRSTTFGDFIAAQFLALSIDGTTTSDGETAVTGGWTFTTGTGSLHTYELISGETVNGEQLPNIPGSDTTFILKHAAGGPTEENKIVLSTATEIVVEGWIFDDMDQTGTGQVTIRLLDVGVGFVFIGGYDGGTSLTHYSYIIDDGGFTASKIPRSFGWHHLRFVVNPKSQKFYIDGVLATSKTNPSLATEVEEIQVTSRNGVIGRWADIRLYTLETQAQKVGLDVPVPKDTQLSDDWTNFKDLVIDNSVPVVEQSYETQNTLGTANLGGDGTNNEWRAQGFKLSRNGTCSQVAFKLDSITNSPLGIQAAIFSDDGSGKPTAPERAGILGRWGVIHKDNIPEDGEWVVIPLPERVSLTAGTQYHLVINSRHSGSALNKYQWENDEAGTYPDGIHSSTLDDGANWTQPGAPNDLLFRVYLDAEGERCEEATEIPLTTDSRVGSDYEIAQIKDLSIDGTTTSDGELASVGGWTVTAGTGSNFTYELISGETDLPNIPGSDTTFVLKILPTASTHEVQVSTIVPLTYHCLEWWFYDDLVVTQIFGNAVRGVSGQASIGVIAAASSTNYGFNTPALGSVATEIERSTGWHHAKVLYVGGLIYLFLDGQRIQIDLSPSFFDFDGIEMKAVGSGGVAYFADIKIYKGECPPQVTNLGTVNTDLSDVRLTCSTQYRPSETHGDFLTGQFLDLSIDGTVTTDGEDAIVGGWTQASGTGTPTYETISGESLPPIPRSDTTFILKIDASANSRQIKDTFAGTKEIVVEFWMFDDLSTSPPSAASVIQARATGSVNMLGGGWDNGISTTKYQTLLDDAGAVASNIDRTFGWHFFRMVATPSRLEIFIDGVLAAAKSSPTFSGGDIIDILATAGVGAIASFADIRVYEKIHTSPKEDFGEEEVISQVCYEDCLQTGFILGADDIFSPQGTSFTSQGFKIPKTARLRKVALPLFKLGTVKESLRIEIWEDDGAAPGEPDNGAGAFGLSTGNPYRANILPDLVPTGTVFGDAKWIEVEFPDDVPELTAGTQYHLVLSAPNNDASNLIKGIFDTSSPAYPDGATSSSSDSGATWTPGSNDMMFKIYTTEKPNLCAYTTLGKVEGRQRTTAIDEGATSGLDEDLITGMKHLYHLDSTSAADSIGSANGTITDAVGTSSGLFGSGTNALDFPGTPNSANRNEIDITPVTDFDFGASFSISVWFRLDTLPSVAGHNMAVAVRQDSAGPSVPFRLLIQNPDNKILFSADDGVSDTFSISGTDTKTVFTTGTFFNLIVVWDFEKQRAFSYVNGELDGSQPAVTSDTFIPTGSGVSMKIGQNGVGDAAFDGIIDEVAFWDRALSPTEVRRLFYKGLADPTYRTYYNKSAALPSVYDSCLECKWLDDNDVWIRPFWKYHENKGYGETKFGLVGSTPAGTFLLDDGLQTPDLTGVITTAGNTFLWKITGDEYFASGKTGNTVSPFLQKGPVKTSHKAFAKLDTLGETNWEFEHWCNKIIRKTKHGKNEGHTIATTLNVGDFTTTAFFDETTLTMGAGDSSRHISRGYLLFEADGTNNKFFDFVNTFRADIQSATGIGKLTSTGGSLEYDFGADPLFSFPAFMIFKDEFYFNTGAKD